MRFRIYRYDPVKATLVPLPEIGAIGFRSQPPAAAWLEPRRFRGASNIAAIDGTLYVADPNAHRVQVFDLATLALIRIHDRIADPADVAATAQGVVILDRSTGRVLMTSPASDDVMDAHRKVSVPTAAAAPTAEKRFNARAGLSGLAEPTNGRASA